MLCTMANQEAREVLPKQQLTDGEQKAIITVYL